MYKLDLHTHSQASPDGSLRARDYRTMLASGRLDCIAVTDHNRIDFAQALQAELGEHIIVGEEITTLTGEILGLYLTEVIPAGLSAKETVDRIHQQGGLVYIPHPFETVRQGLNAADLEAIAKQVDIIETRNGRTLQNRGQAATEWASAHSVPGAASSDAHGLHGWGNTHTIVAKPPTRHNILAQLHTATYSTKSTGVIGRIYPKLNRLLGTRRHAK